MCAVLFPFIQKDYEQESTVRIELGFGLMGSIPKEWQGDFARIELMYLINSGDVCIPLVKEPTRFCSGDFAIQIFSWTSKKIHAKTICGITVCLYFLSFG